MRKALILTVLALFGSEALAQKSFRHAPTASLDDAQDNTLFMAGPDGRGCTHPPTRIGSGGFGSSRLGRFDDAQDNEMALDLSPYPAGMNRVIQNVIRDSERRINNDYRVKVGRWDDSQDNEMALDLSQSTINKAVRDTIRLANNDYRVKVGRFDDFEDDTLFTQADLGRMSSPFLSGSGLVGGGGSARGGGVAMGGTGQMNFNVGKNTQLITGLSASHAPGSRVNLAPHVGVNFKFDDQDDEFFAEDDELFTQGDMGRMSGFLGNGGSGLVAGGGSARGGGVAWGGAGQYAHNIGKNTQLIGGASFSHAPGSRVGINPHVGVKFSFDDEEQN